MTISRREMIQATVAGVAGAAALPLAKAGVPMPPVAPLPPKFFTAAEFALVDEMSDMIIPTDQQSGGARAAGVAIYIDERMAEAFEKDQPEQWRAGIKAVEALSNEMHGKAFMASTPEQRLALL